MRKSIKERLARLEAKSDRSDQGPIVHFAAPRGQRLFAPVPYDYWMTTTFVAALRHDEITTPSVFDGPMNGASFLTYVEHFLAPTLRQGDFVVMDNLASHKQRATIVLPVPADPATRAALHSEGGRILAVGSAWPPKEEVVSPD